MRRLGGGRDVAPRGRVHEPAKASARADTGATRYRSVERREAQAPTSLGLRIPGGGPDGSPVVRGQAPSQRVC